MSENVILMNRAPVLTLWGTVVAARLGYEWETALSLGKAVAGLNAQSKARMLGIYGEPKAPERGMPPKKVGLGEDFWIELCERGIPVKNTECGIRAVVKDKPISAESADKYLRSKFGDAYESALAAMVHLANALSPADLAVTAYSLYEQFRPSIPPGRRGWGAKGKLDLDFIRSLADQ